MRPWIAAHSWLLATTFSLLALAACGGSPPGVGQNEPKPVPPAASANPLAGSSPAPGSERLDPDPHPELAHLTEVTTDSLAQGITNYVEAESTRQGGLFPVNDVAQHTSLGLTLMTVHRERLSKLADGRYFACADFKGRDGHVYDVDIFMRAESTGLTPATVIVHKQDGKARFIWVEQNGIWSQAPVVTP
jgi:hypothetical protein